MAMGCAAMMLRWARSHLRWRWGILRWRWAAMAMGCDGLHRRLRLRLGILRLRLAAIAIGCDCDWLRLANLGWGNATPRTGSHGCQACIIT